MNKITKEFDSSLDGKKIRYYIYEPDKAPIAIVQLAHGMKEHIGRYEEFANILNANGILFCGNDHLGHGRTADINSGTYGYFADEKGDEYLVEDVHKLTMIMKEEYGDIPYFLLGHSMGSFIARLYIEKYYKDVTGCMISGTAGKNPIMKLGIFIANMRVKIKGAMYYSKFVDKLAMGSFNKKFEDKNSRGNEWLTRDREVCKKYKEDQYTRFSFTVSGFRDIFVMMYKINKEEWYNALPQDFPVFIFSGSDDPVGNFGKGVNQFYNKLISTNHNNVKKTLYEGARHEVLNEINREEVYEDIMNWIKAIITGVK